ncbi:hypothetical protein [Agaribacterium sp. ZY112]|uniref:hypothetical protein n=1 Tax=Agaribacterium sp. ZY112 TaxID=3233574 RepID=UPI003523B8FB
MKQWIICIILSALSCIMSLCYFIEFIAQDSCLDLGGQWLGMIEGCIGGNEFSMAKLLTPLSIAIALGILLGMSSALVQISSMLNKALHSFKNK